MKKTIMKIAKTVCDIYIICFCSTVCFMACFSMFSMTPEVTLKAATVFLAGLFPFTVAILVSGVIEIELRHSK